MSKSEDILFCNIAITQGLVTKEAAAKALGLCDKREQETGRRPLIGAVFTKYNLMQNQDVQRIYTAVQKRLGRSAGPQLAVARGKKGKKAAASFERRSKPTRPIDPKTLWLGIGGLVVFAAIVVIMFVLVLLPSRKPETGTNGGGGSSVPSSATQPGGPGTGVPGKGVPGEVAKVPAKREIPADVQLQVDSKIGDALSGMGAGPEDGLRGLRTVEKQLREKGYDPPEKLMNAIQQLEERVKEETGSAEAPKPSAAPAEKAAEGAGAQPAEPPAEKPPSEKPAVEKPKEESPGTEDLDKLIDNL